MAQAQEGAQAQDGDSEGPRTTGGHGATSGPAEKGEIDMRSVRLKVEGMMCEHCVAHVTEALAGVRGVSNVAVSLDRGEATLDAGLLVKDDQLVAAVKDAGYAAEVEA